MPASRRAHTGWWAANMAASTTSTAPTGRCHGGAAVRVGGFGLVSVGQQGWSTGGAAARKLRFLRSIRSLYPVPFVWAAEGIAAKFADRATHGIMPTQGCSHAHAQRLAA